MRWLASICGGAVAWRKRRGVTGETTQSLLRSQPTTAPALVPALPPLPAPCTPGLVRHSTLRRFAAASLHRYHPRYTAYHRPAPPSARLRPSSAVPQPAPSPARAPTRLPPASNAHREAIPRLWCPSECVSASVAATRLGATGRLAHTRLYGHGRPATPFPRRKPQLLSLSCKHAYRPACRARSCVCARPREKDQGQKGCRSFGATEANSGQDCPA